MLISCKVLHDGKQYPMDTLSLVTMVMAGVLGKDDVLTFIPDGSLKLKIKDTVFESYLPKAAPDTDLGQYGHIADFMDGMNLSVCPGVFQQGWGVLDILSAELVDHYGLSDAESINFHLEGPFQFEVRDPYYLLTVYLGDPVTPIATRYRLLKHTRSGWAVLTPVFDLVLNDLVVY